jgi:uncharacterized membrane protein YdjX (TVP38/TMEM64 family)
VAEDSRRIPIPLRIAMLAGLVVGLVALGRAVPLDEWLPAVRQWIEGMSFWGPVAFVGAYVVATNLGFPGTPLTVSAGVLFGPATGVAVAMVSSTLSACAMFLIARGVGWNALESQARKRRGVARLQRLLSAHGSWVVGLARLIPFPFLVLNYGFGLTSVPFRTYAVWSFLGMIPMNVLFVMGGEAFAAWAENGVIPWIPLAVALGVGAAAGLLALGARRIFRGSPQ